MPYYKITITDKSGRVMTGIRYDSISDIDVYYQKARQKAITTLKSNFGGIEVVMLSKYSQELIDYKLNNPNDKMIFIPEDKGDGKRKGKDEGAGKAELGSRRGNT